MLTNRFQGIGDTVYHALHNTYHVDMKYRTRSAGVSDEGGQSAACVTEWPNSAERPIKEAIGERGNRTRLKFNGRCHWWIRGVRMKTNQHDYGVSLTLAQTSHQVLYIGHSLKLRIQDNREIDCSLEFTFDTGDLVPDPLEIIT